LKLKYDEALSNSPFIFNLQRYTKLVKPLRTAYTLLNEKGGLGMLNDALMLQATAEIMHEAGGVLR
jgi:hypothetical protein